MRKHVLLALPWLLLATSANAQDDVKKAQMQVEDYLAKLGVGKAGFKRVAFIDDAHLKKMLPDAKCFGVLFPQYPIGIDPPAPLKVANVVVVDKAGKLHALSDVPAVLKYCQANFTPSQTEAEAVTAMRAWLKLSQHMHADGYYQFDLADRFPVEVNDAKKPAQVQGTAKVKPVGGNKGQIEATLTFDKAGKLASAKETVKLVEGIRPICQATRLLDADPVIRKMAERDLLVMGQTCKDYLDIQRASATLELRREIDRVWRQIVAENR